MIFDTTKLTPWTDEGDPTRVNRRKKYSLWHEPADMSLGTLTDGSGTPEVVIGLEIDERRATTVGRLLGVSVLDSGLRRGFGVSPTGFFAIEPPMPRSEVVSILEAAGYSVGYP